MTDPKPDIAAILEREWPCRWKDDVECVSHDPEACLGCVTRARVERVLREILEPLKRANCSPSVDHTPECVVNGWHRSDRCICDYGDAYNQVRALIAFAKKPK